MAIADRNLALGTRLGAQNKPSDFCLVVQRDDGVRFRLGDDRESRAPAQQGAH